LVFMGELELLNLVERLLLKVLELVLPSNVKVLEVLVTDLNVFLHLLLLNVRAEFILVANDVSLESSDFFHEVLVQHVLVDFAAFGR